MDNQVRSDIAGGVKCTASAMHSGGSGWTLAILNEGRET